MNLGVTGMAFVGTCLSWFTLTYFGRRPLFISGMAWMTFCLIIIGAVSFKAGGSEGAKWAVAALILIHVFAYDFTVGPLTYCIVGETSATRLRSKTVGLARNSYNICQVVVSTVHQATSRLDVSDSQAGILNTYMINPTAWVSLPLHCSLKTRQLTPSELGRQGWSLLGLHLPPLHLVGVLPSP
jgi:SP family general alpha glucoside:H+ symporter-like MFS transporter